jgi:hypothetical protein
MSSHDFIDLLGRITLRWLALLGNSPAGIGAQIAILFLTAAKRKWFRWSTWKNWRHTGFNELKRTTRAMAIVWGLLFAFCAVDVLLEDQGTLQLKCVRLESEKRFLTEKADALSIQANNVAPKGSTVRKRSESGISNLELIKQCRGLFADILSYTSVVDTNRPMVIVSTSSAALTERTMNAADRFDRNMALEFFQKFSARIYGIERSFRAHGIDTSRLETHLSETTNTSMFRLVAADLNGMALELEQRGRQS